MIALLGTGIMGLPLVRNLGRAARAVRDGHGDEDVAATYWASVDGHGGQST